MKIYRDKYVGDLMIDAFGFSVLIFGGILPFIGWRWVPCYRSGSTDYDNWPPIFKTVKFGFMWFGEGVYFTLFGSKVEPVTPTI